MTCNKLGKPICLVAFLAFLSVAVFANEIDETRDKAEKGNADAQYALGGMYRNGAGVPQDYRQAAKWYRKAAEQGHADAQLSLGKMYYRGAGVPWDQREAVKWYRKAAEQGDATAQLWLGEMYDFGTRVPRDRREAVKWYRKAAEQGHADAQTWLGMVYYVGRGVPRDKREAVKWYRKAAEQGHADAQAWLGIMYDLGAGVPQDDRQAAKWYRKAAEQGHVNAQFSLGVMYRDGEGVPRNYTESYVWCSLAVASGVVLKKDDATKCRDDTKMKLPPAERSAAQKEATRRWNAINERQADISLSSFSGKMTRGLDGALTFAGRIETGDARKLKARIAAGSVRSISFDSPGGNLAEAMAMGRLIRAELIRTEVAHDAECYSACVIALVGGVERKPDGPIGIHSFYSDDFLGSGNFADASEVYDEASGELESYLKEMRIPVALLDHMKRVSHDDMHILDSNEREAYFLEGVDPVYRQTHLR